ncbi:MAG: hypothetical protein V4603_14565, partial [Pseudomonadota bacterium]
MNMSVKTAAVSCLSLILVLLHGCAKDPASSDSASVQRSAVAAAPVEQPAVAEEIVSDAAPASSEIAANAVSNP